MDTGQVEAGTRSEPRLELLNPYDCWQLVKEASGPAGIARVVWTGADGGPAIVPVNYTVADGFIWFQTAPGSRLAQECCEARVLVEVDVVDAVQRTGWSVVVTGTATCLPPATEPGLLGSLQVWPSGSRGLLIRVAPDKLSGRRLRRRG